MHLEVASTYPQLLYIQDGAVTLVETYTPKKKDQCHQQGKYQLKYPTLWAIIPYMSDKPGYCYFFTC